MEIVSQPGIETGAEDNDGIDLTVPEVTSIAQLDPNPDVRKKQLGPYIATLDPAIRRVTYSDTTDDTTTEIGWIPR